MANVQYNEFHDEAARQRLIDIAEARSTPSDTVTKLVKDELGEEVRDMTRIVRSESNEVYGITTKHDNEIILRIGHWDKRTFEREAWAINQAAKIGVPVPTILAVGDVSNAVSQTYFCIQKKLEGTTLDTLLYTNRLSPERAKPIVEKAGEALGRIHTIKTTGWGYLIEPTRGEHAKLNERYAKVEAESERISAALKKTGIGIEMKIVLEKLKQGLPVFEGHQSLVHGDFGPKHIFVDEEDNITGIIDWEQAESADPVVEFARWNFWFEKASPTEWLKVGHERVTSLSKNYDERFKIAKLESSIWTLMYFTYDSAVEDCAVKAAQAIAESTI